MTTCNTRTKHYTHIYYFTEIELDSLRYIRDSMYKSGKVIFFSLHSITIANFFLGHFRYHAWFLLIFNALKLKSFKRGFQALSLQGLYKL